MKTTAKRALKGISQNAEKETKQNSNCEIIKRLEVPNSPFTIITTEEGSFIVMGKFRISEPVESEEEAWKDAQEITWNRIVQVTMLLWEQLNENKK